MNMESLSWLEPVVWLGLVVFLLLIEALTMGLTTIWFAGGALIAFIAAVLGASLPVQIILFLVISMFLLIFTRPAVARFMNRDVEKTNVDSLIGKRAVVTETVDNLRGSGRVLVGGVDWTARSSREEQILTKDQVVIIRKVDGVKLIVDEKTEG